MHKIQDMSRVMEDAQKMEWHEISSMIDDARTKFEEYCSSLSKEEVDDVDDVDDVDVFDDWMYHSNVSGMEQRVRQLTGKQRVMRHRQSASKKRTLLRRPFY